MKDIIHHFSVLLALCLSLIFLVHLSFAQSQIKDTVFVSDNETVHAHYLNGKAVGEWKIAKENGNYEIGKVELKKNIPKKHQRKNSWGYQVGKWNYYHSDSSLAFVTEYNYSKNNRIFELKHFQISQKGDTIFDFHTSDKRTLFGKIELRFYKDGHLRSYRKKNSWRFIQKSYCQDKTYFTTEYFYCGKSIESPIKTRRKSYNSNGRIISKIKPIRNSKNELIKTYDPEKSRFTKPKKTVYIPNTDYGFW
jgi:hypothetical protein